MADISYITTNTSTQQATSSIKQKLPQRFSKSKLTTIIIHKLFVTMESNTKKNTPPIIIIIYDSYFYSPLLFLPPFFFPPPPPPPLEDEEEVLFFFLDPLVDFLLLDLRD
jgi:hypothetical protein